LPRGRPQDKKPTFTTLEAPGAGDFGTVGESIHTAGAIAGYYFDANAAYHGFVRAAGGVITTFDVPGAGTGYLEGTSAISINTSGAIAGWYYDAGNVVHGFVRAASGDVATFDAPGAGTGANQGTFASGINAAGAVSGYYLDASNVFHGFGRAASGATTAFEAPAQVRTTARALTAVASTRRGV